jgi:hypothetical protein
MDPEEFFIPEFTTPVTMPDGESVQGIFDNQHLAIALGVEIDASEPVVALLSTTAAGLRDGSRLGIKGKRYQAKTFEPDGDGITIVKLREVC